MMKHDLWLAELEFCNWLLNSNWLQSFMLHPHYFGQKSIINSQYIIKLRAKKPLSSKENEKGAITVQNISQ